MLEPIKLVARICHTNLDPVNISVNMEVTCERHLDSPDRMVKGSVSIYFVQSALEGLLARGIDTTQVLLEAGISPALLQSPHGRVSPQSFSSLWLGVAALLDDELFNQDSRRMKVGSFEMLTNSLLGCGTLHGALQRMVRFYNLLLDDFQCALEVGPSDARLTIRHVSPQGRARPFGFETLLMMQHGLACWLVGRRIPILSASFCYPEPPRSAEYRRMYSQKLDFDEDATAIHFDQALLDLPIVQDQQSANTFVLKAPANIVFKYKNSSGMAAQIRRRLCAETRSEWPRFDALADNLNMAPATLRRRLEVEGQSFQLIKDQLRRDMAIEMLCHSSSSIAVIATELGFAESSAFHRAFKKWTGVNPGQYRQRLSQG
jgi:AraC-like DNA-binding protein